MGCGCSLGRPGNARLDAWTPVSAPSGHAAGATSEVQWIISIASSSSHRITRNCALTKLFLATPNASGGDTSAGDKRHRIQLGQVLQRCAGACMRFAVLP